MGQLGKPSETGDEADEREGDSRLASCLSPLATRHSPLIFLLGSRGSGKTTTARRLAERLGWAAIDADDLVEQRAGKSIREVFAEQGESAFRDLESAVLAELCTRCDAVVATGGGVVLRPGNRELLQKSGWCIWLTADVATLWQRMLDDPATAARRPNLTIGGIEEIAQVLQQRQALYQSCAHHVVPTAGRTPDEVVDDIVRAWQTVTPSSGEHNPSS